MLTKVCCHLNYELETDDRFDTFTPKRNCNLEQNMLVNWYNFSNLPEQSAIH